MVLTNSLESAGVLTRVCLPLPLALSFVIFKEITVLLVNLVSCGGGMDGSFLQKLRSLFLLQRLRFRLGRDLLFCGD
jgi:hypothetical protein